MSVDRAYIAKNDAERGRLRSLALLAHWEQAPSRLPRNNLDEADVDWINDASKPFLLALAPRRAAELAVSVADTVDGKVAALPDDLVARNAAAGSPLSLLRAEHRAEHLGEIEHAFR